MNYDFESLVERERSGSFKKRFIDRHHVPRGIVPLFGAEFDFPTSPYVMKALSDKAMTGSYSYTASDDPQYMQAVVDWMRLARRWEIDAQWIVPSYGILRALCSCIKAFTRPGDGIIIQPPVFGSYAKHILRLGRQVLDNTLRCDNGAYSIDFSNLEELMARQDTSMMILCNPQNPMGVVWSYEDVARITQLAYRHGVLVYSDEIFADLSGGHTYTTPAASTEYGRRTAVTGTSLGKSFSFAGAIHSNIIIADQEVRARYIDQRNADYYDGMDPFLFTAILNAYTLENLDWMRAMEAYVDETARYVKAFFAEHLPEIRVYDRHVAYLLWIDWRAWGLSEDALHEYLYRAGLYMDRGSGYGKGYGGYTRMVIAAPRRCVKEALERLLALVRAEPPQRGDVSGA